MSALQLLTLILHPALLRTRAAPKPPRSCRGRFCDRSSVLLVLAAFASIATGVRAQECGLVDGGGGVVVEIVEPQLLVLDDARVVQLIGLRFPQFSLHGGVPINTDTIIRETLVQHALGKKIKLKHAGRKTDRYGRHLAFVEIEDHARGGSLQTRLVDLGLAQVDMPIEARGCAPNLLSEEDKARKKGAGFWGRGLFAVRITKDEAVLRGLIGTFQLVEGEVTDAAEARGGVTLTFRGKGKSSFSVIVDARTAKLFKTPALGPARLKGRTIRVRGWLIYRKGPAMQIAYPEQIEILSVDGIEGAQLSK